MRHYTESRLDSYYIGIPWELSEIRTQPWLSKGSLTCDPYHHKYLDKHLLSLHVNDQLVSRHSLDSRHSCLIWITV